MNLKDYKVYLGSLDRELLLDELDNNNKHYKWVLSQDSCLTSKITIKELSFTNKLISACLSAIKKF